MASRKQIIDIPLVAGLATKDDPRAMEAPGLSVCEDVQFDELGGIQTRPQYQAITDSASNTLTKIRKLTAYGDELVAFTKDKLWSYANGDGLWTQRAEYLAVKVDEDPRFVTTGEQFDCDRAELDGITMYCWTETTPSGTVAYVAAIDTLSGSVKLTPVAIKSGATRPRLLLSRNKIFLLFVVAATPALWVRAYVPSTLASAEVSTGLSSMVAYDAIIDPDTETELIVVVSRAGSGYTIANYTETPAASGSVTNARTSDGAISVSSTTGGTQRVCVTYSNGTAITADILDPDFTDVLASIAVGTAASSTVNQIASSHDGTLFHIFWTAGATVSSNYSTFSRQYDNAGAAATAAFTVVVRCGIASRAFTHDSAVFVWTAFASQTSGAINAQIQNTYFLYRSDGLLIAKSVATLGGGFPASDGHLPSVLSTATNIFKWCGQLRRIVPLGLEQQGYTAKSPQDVTFEFDSDEARRTAMLGKTLYVAGGQVMQYDGSNLTECGFHIYPFNISAVLTTGTNLTGIYNWLQSYSWTNAKGEQERSTTATIFTSVSYSAEAAEVKGVTISVTAKTGIAGEVALEFWRTIAAAPVGAPYYLVTSKDPASTGDNAYIENDPTTERLAVDDNIADTALIKLETYPENGGLTLGSQAPPSSSIIHTTQDRVILAGIPGSQNRIAYSRVRGVGEVASFNDILTLDLPPTGGKITGIAFLNETLIVFKSTAVFALPGDGFDNNGGGSNYGPARLLDSDVGAINAEGIVLTPKGLLFKSSKGWFLLNHGWQANYVGRGVDAYDSDTIVSCEAMVGQHQVRCISSARTIVWDYLVGEWMVWTTTAVDAVVWGGTHHIVNAALDGALAQATTYSGSGDLPGLDIETGWLKTGQLQGFKLIRKILILGEYLGAHDLRVRVAYDYTETASGPTWVDDKTWTVSPTTVNGPLQVRHKPSRAKCQSIKIRITAQAIGVTTHPISQALNLTGLSLEVALREGAYAGLGAAQKQ